MQAILLDALGGEIIPFISPSAICPCARLHVIIATTPGAPPKFDEAEIERRLIEATRSWTDILNEALVAAEGEEKG